LRISCNVYPSFCTEPRFLPCRVRTSGSGLNILSVTKPKKCKIEKLSEFTSKERADRKIGRKHVPSFPPRAAPFPAQLSAPGTASPRPAASPRAPRTASAFCAPPLPLSSWQLHPLGAASRDVSAEKGMGVVEGNVRYWERTSKCFPIARFLLFIPRFHLVLLRSFIC
jgi:hypothetical protein